MLCERAKAAKARKTSEQPRNKIVADNGVITVLVGKLEHMERELSQAELILVNAKDVSVSTYGDKAHGDKAHAIKFHGCRSYPLRRWKVLPVHSLLA